ncbi:type II toxin-antitoxin system prevent-host-death family antitoxin [bacterium]|nr:type II toxin-antitoxin system prevent-host-death family antitoxin [bacterium]
METLAISDLRANITKILKTVEHGTEINITSRGKIIARLLPPEFFQDIARKKLNAMAGDIVLGDITSPVEAPWKALSQ